MFTGKTIYPDEYSAKLTTGHNLLLFQDPAQKKKGLETVDRGDERELRAGARARDAADRIAVPELRPRIDEICEQYVKDFEKNIRAYAGRDGYNLRLEAIRLALIRLQQMARVEPQHAIGRGV